MKQLEVIRKLYEELGFDEPDIVSDISNNYLTEHTARNGKDVLWYVDESHNAAIYVDSEEFLSETEINKELC
ncbi:MAG: hypothetical protein K6G88_11740 [Lachnospiraceae bacterium]|nr:hypothetical protein [Lachnospiraceae bacterium]